MVAWDGSREAARAVHDALPFMVQASRTTVVTVNCEPGVARGGRISGSEIAAVIARHGAKVKVNEIEAGSGVSIGDVLLSHLADIGADLLAMGAYGHARWQELVMGGATRTFLKSMTVPALMSH
jgi:nucleotide-binding universal stress UspA family protein